MSRERSWIDYANLASNLVQNVQIKKISDAIEFQQFVTEAKELDAEEQNKRRQALWDFKQCLLQIDEVLDKKPAQQALILFKFTNAETLDAKFFNSWEDKERVEEIKKIYRKSLERVEHDLGSEKMLAVKNASVLLQELPELPKKAKDKIKAIEALRQIQVEVDMRMEKRCALNFLEPKLKKQLSQNEIGFHPSTRLLI
jgi:hypothetical protein